MLGLALGCDGRPSARNKDFAAKAGATEPAITFFKKVRLFTSHPVSKMKKIVY